MKKLFVITLCTVFTAFGAAAQESYEILAKSDSIINVFDKALKNVKYEKTELVSFGDNVYFDEELCDTFLLENTNDFKFLRSKEKNGYALFEYYTGKIYNNKNEEKTVYYFYNHKLLLTCNSYYTKEYDPDNALEEVGYFFTFEEKRMVFGDNGKPWGYIVRDGEGNSKQTDMRKIQFSKIDINRIIYDKNMFETIGMRLMDGEIDFLYY
ncbi:MAG: hypothetical protein IKR94_04250 [Bacteroidales bacterium]|nr:hypothetical protein [Bacteroidales bacterium]